MALETVLLALGPNDSDRVDKLAQTVLDIASPADAHIVLAHVFTEDEFETAANRLDFANPGDASPAEVATRLATVREVANRLDAEGIEYVISARIGSHGTGVVDIATQQDVDLVVGGRQRSPAGKAMFGSTAQQVLLESPSPVTFVRGE